MGKIREMLVVFTILWAMPTCGFGYVFADIFPFYMKKFGFPVVYFIMP
jgi:hypothetical protein